jgi:glutamate 5-kinase
MHPSQTQQTIVLKFGTGILTLPDSPLLDDAQFDALTAAVATVYEAGHRPVIVSSGAVGAGLEAFGLDERPDGTAMLQACAAVGQARLMHRYETLFRRFGLNVAQLLVTNADFQTDKRRSNFRHTLLTLLELPKIIPIINENDSVATEELRFGDNDALSAGVAELAAVDQLIILTSTDGLYDASGAQVESVTSIDDALGHVRAETGKFSVGGMRTKLEAVRQATEAGVSTIIASGRNADQIPDLVAGSGVGTRFAATTHGSR